MAKTLVSFCLLQCPMYLCYFIATINEKVAELEVSSYHVLYLELVYS